jgi:hypothetical protein
MAQFMIAHLQQGRKGAGRILSEISAASMHAVQFMHHPALEHGVGYSFGVVPARSQTVLMHDGGYTGVGSRLCLCPESRIGFFVACNIMDGSLIDDVSRALLDLFIPPAPADSTKYPLNPVPPYDPEIAGFIGTYRYSRYAHGSFEKAGVLIGMGGQEMTIRKNDEGMILMDTFSGTPRRMVQVQRGLFRSIDDRYTCAFRRDPSGSITHLFTNGTTAFEKLAWYETASVQRGLLGFCLLIFGAVSIVIPAFRKRGKLQRGFGLYVDPIRWFSQKTASAFLLYLLAAGLVMVGLVPREELAVGFAHGMHWTMYGAQTVALLGILLLAGLLGMLFWRGVLRSGLSAGEPARSIGMGLLTAVTGLAFVWFLWTWNLVGYRF